MKKSPLNSPYDGRAHGARHTSYWKWHENTNNKGYQAFENNDYQSSIINNDLQPSGDDFIPLNISTPVRHGKNNVNQYSSTRCSNSPHSGWKNRNNYQNISKSSCNNRYTAYNQFYGQKTKAFKGGQKRQVNISAYVDLNSFFEDPWQDLMEKLNHSKHKNEVLNDKSNFKLADSNSVEKFNCKLQEDTGLNNSQYNQKSKNESSVGTSFDTDLDQISKSNSSTGLGTDTRFSQDSLDESTCSTNKICETV